MQNQKYLRGECMSVCVNICVYSSSVSSSFLTLSVRRRSQPWLPSVTVASPLTAAVSCGLALNCAPATVNVYVYQSNAMCLCYMALWTRRLSKTHRLVECGPRRRVYGPLRIWEKWSVSSRWFCVRVWPHLKAGKKKCRGKNEGEFKGWNIFKSVLQDICPVKHFVADLLC